MLNPWGEEIPRVSVTLPKVVLPEIEDDKNEVAARFAEQRTIRAGIDAWQAISKAETFDGWKAIGKALQMGRDHALRSTGANRPMGRRYCEVFSEWITQHHFDKMPKSVRSVAIELNENLSAIESWRQTLSEKQRKQLVHPLSNVRRWRQATAGKTRVNDAAKAAAAAWRRFVAYVDKLPPDQAAPFWQAAQAQALSNMAGTHRNER